jgi:hypothetical protein
VTTISELISRYTNQTQLSNIFSDKFVMLSILSYASGETIYDGVTSAVSALNDVISAVPSSGGTIVIPNTANGGTYVIDSDVTIPYNVNLVFLKGANIEIASGKTLTVNGQVHGGRFQVFSGDGTLSGDWTSPDPIIFLIGAATYNTTEEAWDINSTKLGAFANARAVTTYKFPAGTYRLSSTVTFYTRVFLELDGEAEIKAVEEIDCMFNFTSLSTFNRFQGITGGIINGDKKATDILRLNVFSFFLIDSVFFKNAKNRYVATRTEGINPAGLWMSRCYLINEGTDYTNTDNIGVELNCTDSIIQDVVMKDVTVGVRVLAAGGNNKCVKVHPWISQQDRLPYTLGFEQVDGSGSRASFIDCDCDTINTGFYLGSNTDTLIQGCTIYDNTQFGYATQPIAFSINASIFFARILNCVVIGNARNSDLSAELGRKLTDQTSITGHFDNTRTSNTVTDIIPDTVLHTNTSFTPTIIGTSVAGSHSYSAQSGSYTRVGNIVHFSIVISVTLDATISGNMRIKGLPLDPLKQHGVIIGYHVGFGANSPSNAYLTQGDDEIRLFYNNAGTLTTINAASYQSSAIQLWVNGSYIANNTYI